VTAPSADCGRREQVATRIAFLIAGFATGAWAPLVPFLQGRLGIDAAVLGLLLLCLGVGSIVAMPLAGMMASRRGCRAVIIAASIVLCLPLPLLAAGSSLPLAAAALLVFGAGLGSLDCVMNIQAIIVERDSGRPMMSGFHGLFSIGGFAGAGGVAGLLSLGASPLMAIAVAVALMLAAIAVAAPGLLPYAAAGGGPAFAVPRGAVLLIGALCCIVFLAEGSMLDWGAVFLTTVRGVAPEQAGLSYAVFATTMTIGRLTGDRIVHALGPKPVVILGGICAGIGFAVATLVPAWQGALLGYALVGAGCSNIVPVLFTAVGRQTDMPEHLAVPAITTLGYAGILAGPSLIGFVAHATSLPIAFLGLGLALFAVALGGRFLRV